MNYYAIGQVTPGIIAINTATFIGYKLKGIIGGMVATLGMVFPSLVIIITIAMAFSHFSDNTYVQNALVGIRIAVSAIMIKTVIDMAKKKVKDLVSIIIFVSVVGLGILLDLSAVWCVTASAICGILIYKDGDVK